MDPTVIVATIGAAGVVVTALIGMGSVWLNRKFAEQKEGELKMQAAMVKMEISLDGTLSKMLALSERANLAEGRAEGREIEKAAGPSVAIIAAPAAVQPPAPEPASLVGKVIESEVVAVKPKVEP